MKISILVPTKNRIEFILKLIRYYNEFKLDSNRVEILIGDSSDINYEDVIRNHGTSLNIEYFYIPELNDSQAIKFLANKTNTELCVFSGDDDLFVPEALYKCIDFLYKNTNYTAVAGDAIIYSKGGSAVYRLPRIFNDNSIDRLGLFLNNYAVSIFCVHYTRIFRMMYKDIDIVKCRQFTEIIPCTLSAVYGNIGKINSLYLLRQMHDKRNSLPGGIDWLLTDEFKDSLDKFYRCINIAIEIDPTDIAYYNNIRTKIKSYINIYISKGINSKDKLIIIDKFKNKIFRLNKHFKYLDRLL